MNSDKKTQFGFHILEIVAAALGINLERASESDLQRILDAYRVMSLQAGLVSLVEIYRSSGVGHEKL